MLTRSLVLALAIGFWPAPAGFPQSFAQQEPSPASGDTHDNDVKLPSGKSQREEILKAEHQKSLRDVAELVRLSTELQAEIEKNDYHVLSLVDS